jgi:drug/metabolite transporter (DMT)-like permease
MTALAFAGIVVCLGLNFVAVRFSNRELPPLWGAGLRFVLASALLIGVVAVLRLPLPRGRALAGAVAFGGLAFGAAYAFIYAGMVHVPASMAAVLFASLPLATLLLAVPLGIERLQSRGAAGASLVLVGMTVAFGDQLQSAVPPAALAAVAAGVLFTAAATILMKLTPKSNPVAATALGMPVGAGLLLISSALAGEQPVMPTQASTWLALAWVVASSIGGFVLLLWVLACWSASATAYAAVLTPLVAACSGTWLAGEALTPAFLAGSGLVVFGVYVAILPHTHDHDPTCRRVQCNPSQAGVPAGERAPSWGKRPTSSALVRHSATFSSVLRYMVVPVRAALLHDGRMQTKLPRCVPRAVQRGLPW